MEAFCPVCHERRGVRLYRVTAEQAAQYFLRRDVDPERHAALREEIERLWDGPTCEVVRCEACSFVHAHPYVAGRERFYGLHLDSPSYPEDRFEFGRTRRALEERWKGVAAEERTLLEVGAGDGAFVRQVVPSLAAPERVRCTEFSEKGVRAIRALGIGCERTDVRQLGTNGAVGPGRFSAICMFQVLEHMDDLDGLWEAFNRLSTARGEMFLSMPNNRWTEFQERRTGLLDMPPNHVGRWTRGALAVIGGRHGWELVDHQIEPTGRRGLLREVALARFFAARQRRGSLTDRTTRIANRRVRRLASVPVLALWHLWALPLALGAEPRELGAAQWAHLRRVA